MADKRIRCTVTRYSVVDDRLVETTTEEETGYAIEPSRSTTYRVVHGERTDLPRDERLWLYLNNSEASGPVEQLLEQARRGQGWPAQAGAPPVKVECQARSRKELCCAGPCE